MDGTTTPLTFPPSAPPSPGIALFRRRLDGHQMAFALGEALAHLHYLTARGALDRITDADGVNRFVRSGA